MADMVFALRITADGRAAIGPLHDVRAGVDGIREGTERATGAMATFKGALAALQIDRVIRDIFSAATETIRFAASLDDLSDMTGSTVDDLSALANMAKFSGVSFGTVETALAQFSRRLTAADDDSKRLGAGLRALGIEARDPATAFREVAVALDRYADGAEKAALVQEIFGRGGMQLLPLLKDLAREQEVGVRITQEQAEAAERLEKEWAKLRLGVDSLIQGIATGLVPALADAIEQMRQGIRIAGGFGRALLDFGLGLDPFADLAKNIEAIEKRLQESRERNLFGWNDKLIQTYERQLEFLRLLREQQQRTLIGGPENFDARDYMAQARPPAPVTPGAAGTRGGGSTGRRDDPFRYAASQINEAVAAQRELERATRDTTRTIEETNRAMQRANETRAAANAAAFEAVNAYEDETDAIGRTAAQLVELELQRAAEQRDMLAVTIGLEEATRWYDLQTAAIKRRAAANDAAELAEDEAERARRASEELARLQDQAQRAADDIGAAFADAMLDAFSDTENAGKRLLDSLKQMFSGLVLRPILQMAVAPLAGAAQSLLGNVGLGGVGSPLGSNPFGNIASLIGGVGNASAFGPIIPTFGSSFLGGIASPLSTIGSLFSGGTAAFGGGLGALGAGLGAAVPLVGFGLGLASLFGAFDRGGPKTGGFGSNISGLDRFFTPSQGDAQMRALVDTTAAAFRDMLRSLGGTGRGGFAFGFDEDPEGTAGSRISTAVDVNGRRVYGFADRDVGRDQGATQAALATEARRALLAALQASELPSSIAAVLNTVSVEAADEASIDALLQFASAMGQVIAALDGDPIADAERAWQEATSSIVERLRRAGDELTDLAQNQDGTTESMQRLAEATANYRGAVVETILAVRQAEQAMAAMFASTRESVEFGGLGNQAAYDLHRERADALFANLASADSPEAVAAIGDAINRHFMAAWNLLSAEEMMQERPEFLRSLSFIEEAITERLRVIGQAVEDQAGGPLEAVQGALDGAASKYDASATRMATASDTLLRAAESIERSAASFDATVKAMPAPVTLNYSEVGAGA